MTAIQVLAVVALVAAGAALVSTRAAYRRACRQADLAPLPLWRLVLGQSALDQRPACEHCGSREDVMPPDLTGPLAGWVGCIRCRDEARRMLAGLPYVFGPDKPSSWS